MKNEQMKYFSFIDKLLYFLIMKSQELSWDSIGYIPIHLSIQAL